MPMASPCTRPGRPLASCGCPPALHPSGVPAPAGGNVSLPGSSSVVLNGVSCPLTGSCTAVGHETGAAGDNGAVVVAQTASGWKASVAAVPSSPPAAGDDSLAAVSCWEPGDCTAVGSYQDPKGTFPLIDTEIGSVWQAPATMLLPANGFLVAYGALTGVSCPSAGHCTAVGYYTATGGGNQGLAADQAGSKWTASEVRFGSTAQLNAISCSSSGCLAVGSGVVTGDSPEAIATAAVNGAFGPAFVVKAPAGSSGIATLLYGVSCTSPATCTAVGSYDPSSTYLATAWAANEVNGTWKTPVTVQTPLAGAISVLSGTWAATPVGWSRRCCPTAWPWALTRTPRARTCPCTPARAPACGRRR